MARNRIFKSRPAPFANRDDVQVKDGKIYGPLGLFNPTRARFARVVTADEAGQTPASQVQYEWRSRDNRKGRHALIIPAGATGDHLPRPTSRPSAVLQGIGRMFTTFPWWDVSFLVAFFFSVGCAIFIVCGLFYWLPLVAPSSEFPDEVATAGGVTSFIGGTLFQIGAIFLVIEAVNENQTGCFGWELQRVLSKHGSKSESASLQYRPEKDSCQHSQACHQGLLTATPGSKVSDARVHRKWTWWPTWHELRTHYFHEIGFVSSFVEFVGATIFWVNTILSLPGAFNHLSQGVLWGLYWLTYLVGGVFFIIASGLYLLETQPNWYTPAPHLLGWHIGFWNMIGSVGWTLAASLGYCNLSGCEYQSDLTLIWASVAFLIGSLLLWYEALNKYPVERERAHKS
ncbi:hypothetical protein NA57DRAFT_71237 [Rhizodiscina lignyota]|uniref:Integral membrane protein n=1 Tax=Rhizodiscina lignyota TaxID=1504668 RepID=A0A9P4MBV6_9PEZI|nr:hypothetical protein NA57DRAFT_71237 [Rhizodiscina lignyota]